MRFYPVTWGVMRMTVEDVEYEGVVIPAGTFVLVNTAAANRDANVYDDPDGLDITREGRRRCSRSARGRITASARIWPGGNSPKPFG